jgi:hypothetical protein
MRLHDGGGDVTVNNRTCTKAGDQAASVMADA